MKTIPNLEAYMITEDGRVWSTIYKKFMKPFVHKSGYLYIKLVASFKNRVTLQIHRLVAISYLGPSDTLTHINHIDGDKLNNHFTNLEWSSNKLNNKHAQDTGLCVNRCVPRPRIPKETKEHMKTLSISGVSNIKIGEQLGYSTSTVGRVLKAF